MWEGYKHTHDTIIAYFNLRPASSTVAVSSLKAYLPAIPVFSVSSMLTESLVRAPGKEKLRGTNVELIPSGDETPSSPIWAPSPH